MKRFLLLSLIVVYWVGPAFSQNLDREAFLDAEFRFLGGNYSLALEKYDEFIRQWPDSVYAADARYRRAVTLYRLGRSDAAYAAFSTVESRYRSTKYMAYIPFWKGVIEYDRGDFLFAIGRFTTLVKEPPDQDTYRQSLLYLGKAYAALGDTDRAIESFERLFAELSKPPLHPESEGSALVLLFGLYDQRGDYQKVVDLWGILKVDRLSSPNKSLITLRAADAYVALGQGERAVPLLDSLSDDPQRDVAIGALRRLLEYQRKQGNEGAVQAVIVKAEYALRSDPQALADFWLRVGQGAFNEGRFDVARSYFSRISAFLPPSQVPAEVPIYLAEMAYKQGNLTEAYRICATAEASGSPESALLALRSSWYALLLEDWEGARSGLTRALGLAGKEGRKDLSNLAQMYLVYALYRAERPQEALNTLQGNLKPLGVDCPTPLSPEAVPIAGTEDLGLLTAELYRRTGKLEDSLGAYNSVLKENPKDGEVHIRRMALLFSKGQFEQVVNAAQVMDSQADLKALSKNWLYIAAYMRGISLAITGNYQGAVDVIRNARDLSVSDPVLAPWMDYYRGWSEYRLADFKDAAPHLSDFAQTYPDHPLSPTAAYLAAWSYARMGDYESGQRWAGRSADMTATTKVEDSARSRFLQGVLLAYASKWQAGLAALETAQALRGPGGQRTSYTVKAALERARLFAQAGQIDSADGAYLGVQRDFADDPLAETAAFERGQLLYQAQRWAPAADALAGYRQAFPKGRFVEGALYFGALCQQSLGKIDGAILLWERQLKDFPAGPYRLSASLALGAAYWEKQDWPASFRVYTDALAEFGERAKSAGLQDRVEMLRYLMAQVPEKAARFQVILNREHGTSTATGRAAAIGLARFYINESPQREAALPLLEEVVARAQEDPASAAEAYLLEGDYYTLLERWDQGAQAYLQAVSIAVNVPDAGRTTEGQSIKTDLVPEALFKAARSRLRSGKADSAQTVVADLARLYPASPWTIQAKKLLENRP